MIVKLEDGNLDRLGRITEIANLNPVFCKDSEKLSEVVNKAISQNHRRLPVVSKGNMLVGIVTYMDVLDALSRGQGPDAKISNIMTRDFVYSSPDETIEYAFQKLKMSRHGGLPILHNHALIGLVTERDFIKRFSDVVFKTHIKDIMTPKPLFISKKFSALNAFESIVNTRYRRLPVVENNKLIGIVTSFDMIEYLHRNNYDLSSLNRSLDIIMKTSIASILGNKDISEAIKLMKSRDVGGILIADNDKLEGIVTERDVLEQIS